jgi:hypothetical protein
VWAAQNKKAGCNPNATHFDMVCTVRHHINASPVQWDTSRGIPQTEGNAFGWRAMLEGRISKNWHETQKRHRAERGSQRSTAKWAKALIFQLIQIAWQLSLHRNDALHRSDERLADEVINTEVGTEHTCGPAGCIDERLMQMLQTPLSKILERTTQSKRD